MANNTMWPKRPVTWPVDDRLYVSIPFTWNLPEVKTLAQQTSWNYRGLVVGGPAVQLMPDYFNDVPNVTKAWWQEEGALQRVNPLATRTTTGCIRSCKFCGIGQGKIEQGGFRELEDWPDLPVVCDNNLLASSQKHFDKVMDRLEKHTGVDFNQGLDARLLTAYHAQRFARLRKSAIRLSCDTEKDSQKWECALTCLLENRVKRSWVSTYALIGFEDTPDQAWSRCEFLQKTMKNFSCLPMWFHELDCLEWNQITPKQRELGWTSKERTRIMRRFYKAKLGGFVKC